MLQSKDMDWLNGYKNKNCICAVHKRPTFRGTESEGMEKDIPCKWISKKAGVAIVISDKIDFKM